MLEIALNSICTKGIRNSDTRYQQASQHIAVDIKMQADKIKNIVNPTKQALHILESYLQTRNYRFCQEKYRRASKKKKE
jgi:hypothetical protein